jgi:hypothetical protein
MAEGAPLVGIGREEAKVDGLCVERERLVCEEHLRQGKTMRPGSSFPRCRIGKTCTPDPISTPTVT